MDRKLNIIDCPGSDDFCGSLFSASRSETWASSCSTPRTAVEVGSEIQARYARLLAKNP